MHDIATIIHKKCLKINRNLQNVMYVLLYLNLITTIETWPGLSYTYKSWYTFFCAAIQNETFIAFVDVSHVEQMSG